MALVIIAIVLLVSSVNTENSTISQDLETSDVCGTSDFGPWSRALEDWATTTQSDRHGRIMVLPPSKGYYVSERIDTPYLSPPPLPPAHITHGPPNQGLPLDQGQMLHKQGLLPFTNHVPPSPGPMSLEKGYMLHKQGLPSSSKLVSHAPQGYKEWEVTPPPPPGAGKIVNRPPNPYKDKYRPNYQQPANTIDRVDEPPRKQVSETDLHLLGAIEKLVYRVDLMEKRLRKMEESVHYVLAGQDAKPEACGGNFTRVGAACYSWSAHALHWKGAALACRARRAALLELADPQQSRRALSRILSDDDLRGSDFWTGGLNPGLLWIWSHSAKPVEANATDSNSTNVSTIHGEGRCLALQWEPARNTYVYRARDCASALRYICELTDDGQALANEVQRVARGMGEGRNLRGRDE